MADRAQFQKKLGELLAVAASQNNKMTSQEVQAFFQDDNLTDEQMNLVHEFLMSQKVEVIGYTGTIENVNNEMPIALHIFWHLFFITLLRRKNQE